MADVSEDDSDVEMTSESTTKVNKKKYTHQTRDLSTKAKKSKLGDEDADESEIIDEKILNEEEDDEEYFKRFLNKEIEYKEDDLEMQLRFEREEQERKAAAKKEEENKKTKTDPDGTVYEWDENVKGWFPKIPDQDFIKYQQQSYVTPTLASQPDTNPYKKMIENTNYLYNGAFYKWDFANNKWINSDASVYAYVDFMTGISYEWSQEKNEWVASKNQTPSDNSDSASNNNNNKDATSSSNKQKLPQTKEEPKPKKEGWFDVNEDKNTNVYVSGLPLDITDEEFEEMMSKYGIIMKDPLSHKLKLKLYKEDDQVKGDGRCCYLMPESVKLCLQLLDGSIYKDHKIKVEKAKFEMKGTYDPKKAALSGGTEVQKKKLNKHKEKKIIEKQRQKYFRILDWEDRPEITRQKYEKVVVIKNIFSPDDFKSDSSLIKKFKDDLKTELETYGDVKKIMIYEHNPEGVATISFKDIDMADTCCEYLNNRVWKNGRIITCVTWDGDTKYDYEESEEERQKRIDEWHKFLESDD